MQGCGGSRYRFGRTWIEAFIWLWVGFFEPFLAFTMVSFVLEPDTTRTEPILYSLACDGINFRQRHLNSKIAPSDQRIRRIKSRDGRSFHHECSKSNLCQHKLSFDHRSHGRARRLVGEYKMYRLCNLYLRYM